MKNHSTLNRKVANFIFKWEECHFTSKILMYCLYCERYLLEVKVECYNMYVANTLEPLIAYTLIAYEGGASGRSRLVGGGFSL